MEALRRRDVPTIDVAARIRLTKSPARYLAGRNQRRELPYEALMAAGRSSWSIGDRIRVYRTASGGGALAPEPNAPDPRDYDVDSYVRLLHDTFAARLARAFNPADFTTVIADLDQLSLFPRDIESVRTILTPIPSALAALA